MQREKVHPIEVNFCSSFVTLGERQRTAAGNKGRHPLLKISSRVAKPSNPLIFGHMHPDLKERDFLPACLPACLPAGRPAGLRESQKRQGRSPICVHTLGFHVNWPPPQLRSPFLIIDGQLCLCCSHEGQVPEIEPNGLLIQEVAARIVMVDNEDRSTACAKKSLSCIY